MATISEFLPAAEEYRNQLQIYYGMMQSYVPFYRKMQTEDPCADGFAEKLQELDNESESANQVFSGSLKSSAESADVLYRQLSSGDKKDAAVVTVFKQLTALNAQLRTIKEGVSLAGRQALKEKLAACPPKDPNPQTKPEAEPPKTSDTEEKTAEGDDNQKPKPNRRGNAADTGEAFTRLNPLSKFSSYAYGLTLYMMTPECANAFAATGVMPQSTGRNKWIIIAQTSSINNIKEPRGLTFTGDLGPGQAGLNFYLDELTIQTYMLAQDRQRTATVSTEFSFKVVEPIGFTFLTKMSRASKEINNASGLNTTSNTPLLYQQHYAVGIRFYGYNENGEVIKSTDLEDSSQIAGDGFGVYERVFPIIIQKVGFRLNGRQTVYNFEAVMQNLQASFGIKRGYINTPATIEGATVGDILGDVRANKKSLINFLNDNQKKLKDNNAIDKPATYSIEWIDNQFFDAKAISNSSILTDAEYNPNTTALNNISTTKESTVKLSVKNVLNTQSKSITIPANTSIPTAIDQIISKSKYISEKLLAKASEKIESESKPETQGKLEWFAVHPVVTIKDRDEKTKDWVYDIKYQIMPYEVPYVKNQYVNSRSKYYGPVKKYAYSLTGENTEVINFEMEFNNLYYIITPTSTTKNQDSNKKTQGSTPAQPSGGVNDNSSMVFLNKGGSILENLRANLYSPADMAVASMKILGDPDFLMTSIGTAMSSELLSKFKAKNGTINPYGGQLFTEIIFNVAEDYNMETGLLDVDESRSIGFYTEEEQAIIGNRGIIYRINSVKSIFARGKFEQDLEMFMVHPSELIIADAGSGSQRTDSSGAVSDNSSGSAASAAFDKSDDSYDRKEVMAKQKPAAGGGGRGSDEYWQKTVTAREAESKQANSDGSGSAESPSPAQNSGSKKLLVLETGNAGPVNTTDDDAYLDYSKPAGLYGP